MVPISVPVRICVPLSSFAMKKKGSNLKNNERLLQEAVKRCDWTFDRSSWTKIPKSLFSPTTELGGLKCDKTNKYRWKRYLKHNYPLKHQGKLPLEDIKAVSERIKIRNYGAYHLGTNFMVDFCSWVCHGSTQKLPVPKVTWNPRQTRVERGGWTRKSRRENEYKIPTTAHFIGNEFYGVFLFMGVPWLY